MVDWRAAALQKEKEETPGTFNSPPPSYFCEPSLSGRQIKAWNRRGRVGLCSVSCATQGFSLEGLGHHFPNVPPVSGAIKLCALFYPETHLPGSAGPGGSCCFLLSDRQKPAMKLSQIFR
jgi:hypothetical protein